MASAIEKVMRILRQEGPGGLVRRVVKRLYTRREMTLFERSLHEEDEVPFLPRHPYLCRLLREGDLARIEPHVSPQRFAEYRERLRRGMTCTIILTSDETECLGWVWTTDEAYYEPYDNATYRKVPGTFLHVDGEVPSERRGRGIAFTVFPLLWPHYRARGLDKAHCAIDVLNKPSLKVHDRLGYKPVGKVVVKTLFGFKWASPEGPRVGPGDETSHG